ncbi:MAG: hypothetical protein IPP46_18440 [Bacteroidetes bacterium]|nr:hypothetical protein [Bacteroidota bacterium]
MRKAGKLLMLLLMGAILLPSIESCGKYEDGPSISLRSRKERVANTWNVENYKVDGGDFTSLVSGYSEKFSKDGDYYYSWGLLSGSGDWSFSHNDERINLNGNDGQSSRTLYILKLEEKEFWYYYMEGNVKHELHLVQN